MKNSNSQILLDVRDTMKLMLLSAELQKWDEVTALDNERTRLLGTLTNREYTGELELIDEIIKLDNKILETAEKAKSAINDKISLTTHTREVHKEYNSIADL